MKVRWVRFPTEIRPEPDVIDDSSCSIMAQCNTPPDGNEIILVQLNIHGTLTLTYALAHEALHWLGHKFKVPEIFHRTIDELHWRLEKGE